MHLLERAILGTLVSAVLALSGAAYGQTTSGSVLGDITDGSGAVIPNATVRIVNDANGNARETSSNDSGAYQIFALPPAIYSVSVEADSFAPVSQRGVVVPIQGQVKLDFQLAVAGAAESILVNADAPLIRPTENSLRTIIDGRQVDELPLLNRDFMDLAVLAPGVTLDQSSLYNSTVTDKIGFFGLEESFKSVWLEGVDFGDEVTTGGTNTSRAARTSISLDAIQEFEVMTTGYSPEFGRSQGGAVSVALKSGGNQIHGSVYGFFQDDAFNANPYVLDSSGEAMASNTEPPLERRNFGGTIGGPIVQDRIFYFFSLDHLHDEDSEQFNIPDEIAAFVENLGSQGLNYNTDTSVSLDRDRKIGIGKLTFELNDAHRLDLSYIYSDDDDINNRVGGTTQLGGVAAADFGFDEKDSSYFASANLTSVLSPRMVNEFRANRSIQRLLRTNPEGSEILPVLEFPSVVFGTNGVDGFPSSRVQRNWILANTTSYQFNSHTLKWGGEVNIITASNEENTLFNGHYVFDTDTPALTEDPISYTVKRNLQFERNETSNPLVAGLDRDIDEFALFFNDTWRVTPTFTVNLGLRWDMRILQGDFGGDDPFEEDGFSRDNPEDVWLNVALGPDGMLPVQAWRPIPRDKLDLSPRVGFSWDVSGMGRTVVRGSYGIYHDRFQTARLDNTVNGYNGLNAQEFTDSVNAGTYFPFAPDPSTFSAGTAGSANVPSPDAKTPYSQQMSLGLQHELQENTVLSVDFTHILLLHQVVRRNVNAAFPDTSCPFETALMAEGYPGCFSMWLTHDTSGRGRVDSVTFRLDRRFSDHVGFIVGYTLGSAKQFNRSGFFGIDLADPYDPYREIDFGPMDNDVTHRLTVNTSAELPYDINLSTIITANSSPPYNHRAGGPSDRPLGVGFNSLRGEPYFNTDLRVAKKFYFDETKNVEVLWEMFNVFNTANRVNFQGNQASGVFQQAQDVLDPFRAQLGVRFGF